MQKGKGEQSREECKGKQKSKEKGKGEQRLEECKADEKERRRNHAEPCEIMQSHAESCRRIMQKQGSGAEGSKKRRQSKERRATMKAEEQSGQVGTRNPGRSVPEMKAGRRSVPEEAAMLGPVAPRSPLCIAVSASAQAGKRAGRSSKAIKAVEKEESEAKARASKARGKVPE